MTPSMFEPVISRLRYHASSSQLRIHPPEGGASSESDGNIGCQPFDTLWYGLVEQGGIVEYLTP
jgi:hypothetical protein